MKPYTAVENSFTQIKIKTYKVMLPILILATTVGIILEDFNDTNDMVNQYSLPILFFWFVALYPLLLRMNSRHFKYIEYCTFVLLSGLFLLKFWIVVHYQLGIDGTYGLGEFFDWIPLYFIFIFFTFNGKRALSISLLFIWTTLLIATYEIATTHYNRLILSPLIQFHLSNLVYVIALYFLQKLKEVFLLADANKKAANTDFLTNLPNRRYMHELLQDKIQKGNKLSVILFDIDNFKKINDRYGHDIGDLVLKEVSHLIKSHLKSDSVLGRWGGEEFLVLAINRNAAESAVLAEEIRRLLEQTRIEPVGVVTSSFGVTEFGQNDAIHSFLNRADKALYEAKDSGKNQVLIR
ncbi:GGDEF domain-containing protein [Fredinandcohnia humi]